MHVVDTIVIAYHGDQWLPACVASFVEAREPGVRLTIADNFGNETVAEFATSKGFDWIDLEGPLGFAEANNQAMVKLGLNAKLVCFLNQDTRSPIRWLTAANEFLERNPSIGALTPLISTYDGTSWDPNFLDCLRPLGIEIGEIAGHRLDKEFLELPVIPAPAMVVRTAALREVGGFDPVFGSYYEDYDLCHRIRAAGYSVGVWTGATIAHFSGSATNSPKAEARRQRLIVRNRIIYRVRPEPRGRLSQLGTEVFIQLPRQLVRRLLRRPASKPANVVLGGYWDAAKVGHRLISDRTDKAAFGRYLAQIGWQACDAWGSLSKQAVDERSAAIGTDGTQE